VVDTSDFEVIRETEKKGKEKLTWYLKKEKIYITKKN
jgi:hypothetical protein